MVCKLTHDYEDNSEQDEAHKLDGPATPGIDEEESDPVTRDQASNRKNEVTDTDIDQVVVNTLDTFAGRATKTNDGKDD